MSLKLVVFYITIGLGSIAREISHVASKHVNVSIFFQYLRYYDWFIVLVFSFYIRTLNKTPERDGRRDRRTDGHTDSQPVLLQRAMRP